MAIGGPGITPERRELAQDSRKRNPQCSLCDQRGGARYYESCVGLYRIRSLVRRARLHRDVAARLAVSFDVVAVFALAWRGRGDVGSRAAAVACRQPAARRATGAAANASRRAAAAA